MGKGDGLMNENECQRYFFAQDCSSHWYLLPLDMKIAWGAMTLNDIAEDDYDGQDDFERMFGEYRTDHYPRNTSFTNPRAI